MSKTEMQHDLSALADAFQDEAETRQGQRRLAEGLQRLQEDTRERQRIDDIADLVEAGHDAYQLGRLSEQQGDLDEAERYYTRAAEAGHDDAACELMRILPAMNKHAQAERWHQHARALGLLHEADDLSGRSIGEPDDKPADSPMAHARTIRCDQALALVYMCLDRELSPTDIELVKRHLDECDGCLGEYSLEQAVKRLVATHCRCDPASPDLRDKVLQRILAVRATIGPEPSQAPAEDQQRPDRPQGTAAASTRTLKKGMRISDTDRRQLVAELKRRYDAGESIRSLAMATGRSYGFIHRLLTEAGVTLRGRASQAREAQR